MVANCAIIKPNQIGTVTETLQAILTCKENSLDTIISHRSGETCDSIIADIAIGTQAGQIKAGGLNRGERLAKYNRLLRVEDKLTMEALNN
jgi:Enolase